MGVARRREESPPPVGWAPPTMRGFHARKHRSIAHEPEGCHAPFTPFSRFTPFTRRRPACCRAFFCSLLPVPFRSASATLAGFQVNSTCFSLIQLARPAFFNRPSGKIQDVQLRSGVKLFFMKTTPDATPMTPVIPPRPRPLVFPVPYSLFPVPFLNIGAPNVRTTLRTH